MASARNGARTGRPPKYDPASNADFVTIWETAPTMAEAARLAGMRPGTASQRATRLREAGVPLKRFPTGKRREALNVAELRAAVVAARKRSPGR